MGDPVTIRNGRDTWLSQANPDGNRGEAPWLHLRGTDTGKQEVTLIYYGTPWPDDANMLTGTARFYASKDWPTGNVTVTVRRLSSNWAARRVTYNRRPQTSGMDFSATVTDIKQYDVIEVPVLGLVQAVANGADYFGVEVTVNVDSPCPIFSVNGPSDYHPELEVSWSDAPDAPEELSPAGNRAVGTPRPTLSCDFTDVSGDTAMGAMRVQLNATDDWAAPSYDSETDFPGGYPTSVPEFDLSQTSFPALVSGQSIWWRVQVQDGAGIWSDWSNAEQFKYVPHIGATITNPGDAPNNFVEDPSPTITWTVTGGTQRHWQLILTHPNNPSDWYWTSGKVTGTDDVFEIPVKEMPNLERTYRLILRVWDDVDREATPNDTIFTHVQKDFAYNYDATVDPVTNLAVETAFPWPWADVSWDRATMPDSFTILRDGDVLDKVDAEDAFVSGTSYTYRDRKANPRVNHTWKVVAHVNGKSSLNSPTLTTMTMTHMTWLMRRDTSDPICIVKSGDAPDSPIAPQMNSMQEMHEPVGGGPPVLITQYTQGYQGHVSGTLADNLVPGLSARDMRDRFKGFMKDPGLGLTLYMVDETLDVVPYNMTYRPRAKSGGIVLYDIEFDFFEDD